MRDTFHANPADIELPGAMNALSDPLRLRIVDLLSRNGEMQCSAIYSELGISKSNASHHFPGLLDAVLANLRSANRKPT